MTVRRRVSGGYRPIGSVDKAWSQGLNLNIIIIGPKSGDSVVWPVREGQ